jgi:hypothetical protein
VAIERANGHTHDLKEPNQCTKMSNTCLIYIWQNHWPLTEVLIIAKASGKPRKLKTR